MPESMSYDESRPGVSAADPPPAGSLTRVADMATMLRVMGPLHGIAADPVQGRRQLLADLCRFIGVKVGTLAPDALGLGPAAAPPAPPVAVPTADDLAPRLVQTLALLLDGDSEKQVAVKLGLSPHTVHQYIKDIYRRYHVSSRGELLARHYKR